ncbi:MAG: CooT family nickel-binding protein [Proteobacteria bacterium]|nr:CooT family nickel-binding protein [Pseudomonadota bacterium]MBU4469220.1 CooT family nickel-binding protein [Pseudomonadota bacterium]MCG2752251.1 CooT family nickel-binding protein [Desulfobacteraceae bacterium]
MCEADAYIMEGDTVKLVLESVDKVEHEENGIRMVNIFGEQKVLKAKIHSLCLVDHKIFLEKTE